MESARLLPSLGDTYADCAIRGRTGAGQTIFTTPSDFVMPAPRIGSLASDVNS